MVADDDGEDEESDLPHYSETDPNSDLPIVESMEVDDTAGIIARHHVSNIFDGPVVTWNGFSNLSKAAGGDGIDEDDGLGTGMAPEHADNNSSTGAIGDEEEEGRSPVSVPGDMDGEWNTHPGTPLLAEDAEELPTLLGTSPPLLAPLSQHQELQKLGSHARSEMDVDSEEGAVAEVRLDDDDDDAVDDGAR